MTVPNGLYELRCAGNRGYCVDIRGGYKDAGTAVQIYQSNSSVAQQFRLKNNGGGDYTITNVNSGKVLTVQNSSQQARGKVIQWDDCTGADQHWYLKRRSDGTYALINQHSKMALDVPGGTIANSVQLQQWPPINSSAQGFELVRLDKPAEKPSKTDTGSTSPSTGTSDSGWSQWSTTKPSKGKSVEVESATQYRYRDMQTTTSTASSMNGWTRVSGPTTTYSDWSGVKTSNSNPGNSETVKSWKSGTTYNYYHYCNYYDGHWNQDSCKAGSNSVMHTISSATLIPNISGFADKGGKGAQARRGGGLRCNKNYTTWWLNSTTDTYSYQTRTKNVTYTYSRWGSWSGWSTSSVSSSSSRDVQTRTVYRTRAKATGGTNNSGSANGTRVSTGKAINKVIYEYDAGYSGDAWSDSKTVSKYDITGDKRADTLKIKLNSSALKFSVNGKNVGSVKHPKYGAYYFRVKYICTSNGHPFLFAELLGDDMDGKMVLLQCKNGKVKTITSEKAMPAKYCVGHSYIGNVWAKGKNVYVCYSPMTRDFGACLDATYKFKWSHGTLKRASSKASSVKSRLADRFTPRFDKRLTSKPGGSKVVATMKTGKKVKVTGFCVKSGKIYFKVKLASGKSGWFKALSRNQRSYGTGTLFKEAHLAG